MSRDEHSLAESRGRVSRPDLAVPERRLQSLARVLQGESQCVAVALVNGRLLIAANELHKHSRTNRHTRFIDKVMTHFKKVAAGQIISSEEIKSLLFDVFKKIRSRKLKGGIPISDALITSIMGRVLAGETEISSQQLLRDYKTFAGAAGWLFGEFKLLYRDFRKIEQSVKTELSDVFQADYEIIKLADKTGIHAEAQLLQQILQDELNESTELGKVSLGISELCCLHCRSLLQAANEVLKEEDLGLSFDFEGKHDLSFQWYCPVLFKAGYEYFSEGNHTAIDPIMFAGWDTLKQIAFKIGHRAAAQETALLLQPAPKAISMLASLSESDEEPTVEEKVRAIRSRLMQKQQMLQALPYEAVSENMDAIALGLKLCDIKDFADLIESDNLQLIDLKIVFGKVSRNLIVYSDENRTEIPILPNSKSDIIEQRFRS